MDIFLCLYTNISALYLKEVNIVQKWPPPSIPLNSAMFINFLFIFSITVTPAPLLEVTPLNNSAVKVTWEVSNTSTEVTGFKLYINRKIGPVHSRYIQLGSDSNSTIVSGLGKIFFFRYQVLLKWDKSCLILNNNLRFKILLIYVDFVWFPYALVFSYIIYKFWKKVFV